MSEFIWKTPEKSQRKRDFYSQSTGILSTAYSESKSPIPWYFHSSNAKYDLNFRQLPNVYPWVYSKSNEKSAKTNQKLKNDEINYQNENIASILEQTIQKIEKNNLEIENLRQNLAYQPDFHISSLFDLISCDKEYVSNQDLENFYREIIQLEVSFEEIQKGFGKNMNFGDFEEILRPKKIKYMSFYEKKRYLIPESKKYLTFELIYVSQTQEMVRRFFSVFLENTLDNEKIIANAKNMLQRLDCEEKREFLSDLGKEREEKFRIFF